MGILRFLWVFLFVAPTLAMSGEVLDATGFTVKVPDNIEKIAAAGPPASVFLYTLAPELMIGWPSEIGEARRQFLGKPASELPVIGSLGGRVGNEANIERFLLAKPDLVIDIGNIGKTDIDLAQMMRTRTNIPYVLLNGNLDNLPNAYRLIGNAINQGDAGEKRAQWLEDHMDSLKKIIDSIPLSKRPSIYYARGADGKETGRSGSIHAEVIERAGAINVIGSEVGSQGILQLSMDNILALDPDIIIASNPQFMQTIKSDPLWQHLRAVKNQNVYLAPSLPYSWIDVPPSVNRIIGVMWLANIIHGDSYHIDMRATTTEFYELFYHVKLSDNELDKLLGKTSVRYGNSQ